MPFKKIIIILAWFSLVLGVAGLFVFINLHHIVELQIRKRVAGFSEPYDIDFNIQKIGFFNAVVSNIRIKNTLAIDWVNVDYDIKHMTSAHLTGVTISGLTVYAGLDKNNQIQFTGLSLPSPSTDQPFWAGMPILPFVPQKIVLQNAKIVLNTMNDQFLIPFDILSKIETADGKIVADTLLTLFGEKIGSVVRYDINNGLENLKIEGRSFDLAHIARFVSKKTDGMQLKGRVDFNIETDSPQKKWKLNLSQAGLLNPFGVNLNAFSSTLSIDKQRIDARGTFSVSHTFLPLTRMEFTGTMDLDNTYYFDLNLYGQQTEPFHIGHDSMAATLKTLKLNARFLGTLAQADGQVTVDLGQGFIRNQNESLEFSEATISAKMAMDFAENGKRVSSTLTSKAEQVMLKSDVLQATLPVVTLSGLLSMDNTFTPLINMTLKGSKGEINASKVNAKASGIDFEVPINYPDFDTKKMGQYHIPKILTHNQLQLSTAGTIVQTQKKEFKITGVLSLLTLPHLKTQFSSIVGLKNGIYAALDFKIPPVRLNFSDIQTLSPKKFQRADVDLTISAKGSAELLNHRLKTGMHLDINDGKIVVPDTPFSAKGINTSVAFNDLLVLETVPGQVLTIDSIEMDKVKIQTAKMRFSIEDGRSWLVENIRFNWCNGLVSTESIRIPQRNNAYFLTLYCDRLEMTKLLKQMGAFDAEGSGTLNGRIPMVYSDGNISFDNGFLFSTPGSGGKVMIKNSNRIIAGIPMGNPQFAQLDLAQEALKDFDYQWAKLVFNTFEDTLDVKMELNGKPSNVLPFAYKKELGGFARVDASNPGSRFQGIKLDVNLKLPFNDVMKFGNRIKSILK